MAMIGAGISGVSALAGLFGGSPASNVQLPPQWQMPGMNQAAGNASAGIGNLGSYGNVAQGTMPFGQSTFSNLYNNPFAQQYQSGAGTAGALGTNAALTGYGLGGALENSGFGLMGQGGNLFGQGNQLFGQGSNLFGQGNQLFGQGSQLFGAGQQFMGQAAPMFAGGNAVLNTAFDPQNDLYNRTLQKVQDQTNVGLSQSGVGTTPYGAGIMADASKNFNIDWANQQLGRQVSGLGAAGSAYGQGANVFNTGVGAIGQGSSLFGQGGNLYGQGGSLFNQGGGLYNTAGGLMGQGSNMIGQGATLQGAAPGQFLQGAGMPYNTYQGIGQNQFGALGGLQGLLQGGQNINQVPIQDYLSYLGIGNSANANNLQQGQLALQQANQGFQQNQTMGGQFGSALSGFGNAPRPGWLPQQSSWGSSIPNTGTAMGPQ